MHTKTVATRLPTVMAATLLFALTGAMNVAFGQATDGNIVGTVTDQSGAAVPNATVEITSVGTNVKTTTTSDEAGEYRFNNLLAGNYDLKITRTGFTTSTLRNIGVALNKTLTANISLQVGDVATTVEVTDTAVLIDTTTAQIQSTFQAREAIDTPASSLALGVYNLALLGAGVANAGGLGLGEGPSVGGQRPRSNSFNIEGVDNNRSDQLGRTSSVPNEAVAEFTMLQNQYSAEFGNGNGGQFNIVVRGGTNQIHGAVYEYLQNRTLNAMDEADKRNGLTTNPRYDQNTFGGAIGGPIVKDKLFYYGLYQYNPFGSASTPSSSIKAPTAAGYAQIAGIPGLSQTNLNILKQYLPAAGTASGDTTTVNGLVIPLGILPVTQPRYTNSTTYLISIDYNVSDKDRLRGRFQNELHRGFDSAALPALPAFFLGRPVTSKFLSLSEFHTFSPTLLNEFRFGYQRYNDSASAGNFAFPGLDVFPNITIEDDLNLQLGPWDNAPQATILNTYQLVENVSWTKGRHTMKFGGEGRKYINLTNLIQRQRGDYNYKTLGRYLEDLNPDIQAERNVGGVPYSGNRTALAFFGNDSFRMKSNFTITAGLRWEWQDIPRDDALQALNSLSSVPGLIDFRKPTSQKTAFAPRIGIAYSPGSSGKTSIRAGFGMAYDKYFDNLSTLSKPPQVESTVNIKATPTIANFLANGGIRPTAQGQPVCVTVQECRNATSTYIYDQNLPYSIQWNLGVQHVFNNDYTVEVRYLGTRGVHLFTQNRLNIGSVVQPNRFLPTFTSAPSAAALSVLSLTLADLYAISPVLPEWAPYFPSNVVGFTNRGNSTYHGLATEVTRRFSRGLLFKGAYTWSHNIDDSTADLFSTLLSPRRPEDFQNMRAERSNSFLDRRHRFTYNWVYDLPWFRRSSNAFVRHTLGGYVFSGTYTYESPQFATVQSGLDSNLNGDVAGDRAIVNLNGAPNTGTAVYAIDRTGAIVGSGLDGTLGDSTTVAYVAINPNAQYIQAGYGARTNSGRQTLATRPINNWDLQFKKEFIFTERYKFQLGVQMINAFNHPQYVPGYINIVKLHESRDTNNNLIPGNSLFNQPDMVYRSNARLLQLTARFQF